MIDEKIKHTLLPKYDIINLYEVWDLVTAKYERNSQIAISMIMPIIAPVNLLVDARKMILHYRDLSCRAFDFASYCDPINTLTWTHIQYGRCWWNAVAQSPNATYESTGRLRVLPWMVRLVTNEFVRFCQKYFWMKADRRFHRCTDTMCPCGKHSRNGKKSYRVLPWFGPCLLHVMGRHD